MFNFVISDGELAALKQTYGTPNGEIKYLQFLKDAHPLDIYTNKGTKSTYEAKFQQFDGETEIDKLLYKIKVMVKKNRMRILEFFQDHDILRKGYIPFMKFKGTLHG